MAVKECPRQAVNTSAPAMSLKSGGIAPIPALKTGGVVPSAPVPSSLFWRCGHKKICFNGRQTIATRKSLADQRRRATDAPTRTKRDSQAGGRQALPIVPKHFLQSMDLACHEIFMRSVPAKSPTTQCHVFVSTTLSSLIYSYTICQL